MANQFRNYILTINNPSQTDDEFCEYLKTLEHLKYFAFQREKGEKKETPHFQLYIEFDIGKRFAFMKEKFPTAHIEQRKGTKQQARDYCIKDDGTRIGNFYEHGTFVEERERTDLTDIIELIRNGANDEEIEELFPSQHFRYYKNIQYLRQRYLDKKYKKDFRKLDVTYIYGSAGIGKTRYVLEKFGYDKVFRVTSYGKGDNALYGLFDSYEGQDIVVFEEFRSSLKIEEILNLLDGYPLQLPCRYNNKPACFTKVFLITNIPFEQQYKNIQTEQPETWRAFKRRIHKIYDFDKSREHNLKDTYKQAELIPIEDDDLPF